MKEHPGGEDSRVIEQRTRSLQAEYAATATWRRRVAAGLSGLWYATIAVSLVSFALVVLDEGTATWTATLAPWAPFALLAAGSLAQYLSRQQALYEVSAHRLTYLSRAIGDQDEADEVFYRRLLAEGLQVGVEFVGGRQTQRKKLQDDIDQPNGRGQ